MKFKFIQKISIIQEKFLVFFILLRGPDMTPSGDCYGPRGAACASLGLYDGYIIVSTATSRRAQTLRLTVITRTVLGKIVFLKIVFYFKVENTILFSIFKILLKSTL